MFNSTLSSFSLPARSASYYTHRQTHTHSCSTGVEWHLALSLQCQVLNSSPAKKICPCWFSDPKASLTATTVDQEEQQLSWLLGMPSGPKISVNSSMRLKGGWMVSQKYFILLLMKTPRSLQTVHWQRRWVCWKIKICSFVYLSFKWVRFKTFWPPLVHSDGQNINQLASVCPFILVSICPFGERLWTHFLAKMCSQFLILWRFMQKMFSLIVTKFGFKLLPR